MTSVIVACIKRKVEKHIPHFVRGYPNNVKALENHIEKEELHFKICQVDHFVVYYIDFHEVNLHHNQEY